MPTERPEVVQIVSLLKRCREEKVLRSSGGALALAEKAVGLSRQLEPVNHLWLGESCYRLAHLLLRTPNLSLDELYRIDELLVQAINSSYFGLMPHLYRLPVLSRIEPLVPADDQSFIRQKIRQTWQKALDFYGRPRTAPPSFIQDQTFNMLELTAYFLGESLEPAIGFGVLRAHEIDNTWKLYGEGYPDYCWSEITARTVFEESQSHMEQALLLELSSRANRWAWKAGAGDLNWEVLKGGKLRQARLLLRSCLNPFVTSDELLDELYPRNEFTNPANSLNQDRGRLGRDITKLRGSTDVFPVFESPGQFEVNKKLRIVAIFEEASL
jgi:hypothetical protein